MGARVLRGAKGIVMPTFQSRFLVLLAALSLGGVACSSSSEPASTDAPTDVVPVDPEVAAACQSQTDELQAAIDGAHGPKTDVVLAVKDPRCGVRFLSSGPGALPATTLHRIGSLTKTYVAAVILQMEAEGLLSTEDPIGRWLPSIPDGEHILVRHLLNHTSGLFNYTEDSEFMRESLDPEASTAPERLIEVAVSHPPYFAPGTDWHYSNTNFIALGLIAEKVGGRPLAATIRERVLAPIGARATFFENQEPLQGELAVGRDAKGRDVTHAYSMDWPWAAGAMVATPEDVLLWIEKLAGGAFLPDAAQARMLDGVATGVRGLRYGLGIMLLDDNVTGGFGRGIGHGGDIPGFHSMALHLPERGATCVAIVDSDQENPNTVSLAAFKVLFRDSP